jgi:hypothetical protein
MRAARAALGLVAAVVVAGGGCLQVLGYEDPTLYVADAGTGADAGTCSNGAKDGNETGKDCGGSCPACPAGEGCKTGADCQSNSCGSAGVCVQPECNDNARNGDETDVDCGGKTCPACAFGKTCTVSHDCVTGFCAGTKCDARTVVQGLSNPNSLAVDGTNVYWADADLGTVMTADLATGTMLEIASGQRKPRGLVIVPSTPNLPYPSTLAWVEPNEVVGGQVQAGRVNTATVSVKPAPVSSIDGGTPEFVVPGAPYWTNANVPSNCIMTSTWGNSPVAQVLVSLPFSNVPERIVKGLGVPTWLAFSTRNVDGWAPPNIWAVPATANASPVLLATYSASNSGYWAIAADDSFVYWADDVAGTVAKVPAAGGTPVVIASGQATPTDVAIDTLYVYWVTQGATPGGGTVMQAPSAGGSAVVLASNQEAPRAIFPSGNDVYWLSGAPGHGAVRSVKK